MSKETVKQAINETIVSNGKRGISAQSLSNVLNLMVDEGGSGSGVLMFKVGNLVDNSGETTSILTSEEKEYNRQIFETCKNAVSNGEPCPLVCFNYTELMASIAPENALSYQGIQMLMAPAMWGYISGPAGAEILEAFGYSEAVMFTSELSIILLPSGDVIFMEGSL